jgi:hypothetical protein
MQPFFIPKPNQEEIPPIPETTKEPDEKEEENQKQLNKK